MGRHRAKAEELAELENQHSQDVIELVRTGAEGRLKTSCPYYKACFVERARQHAENCGAYRRQHTISSLPT